MHQTLGGMEGDKEQGKSYTGFSRFLNIFRANFPFWDDNASFGENLDETDECVRWGEEDMDRTRTPSIINSAAFASLEPLDRWTPVAMTPQVSTHSSIFITHRGHRGEFGQV